MLSFNREQRIVFVIGVSLIVLGVLFLFLQLKGIESVARWVPIIAGAITLALAVLTRVPGFTLLGCLLLFGGGGLIAHVNIGDAGTQNTGQAVFLLFVSAGFCIAPVLTRLIDRKILLWPLLPGIAGLIGGIVLLV